MKNTFRKSLAICLSVILIAFTFILPSSAFSFTKLGDYKVTGEKVYTLVGGVTEREIVLNKTSGDYQQYIFVLEVAPDNTETTFVTGYNDGDADNWALATVRDQAHALEDTRDINVVASVNGDFHNTRTGEPTGLVVMQGQVIQPSNGYPFFGVTKDGTPVIRGGNGRTDDLQEAVAGYCMLVENGQAVAGATGKLAPRTAVGIKADGTIILCVNDGRQDPYSYGFDNDEFAKVMRDLGCVTALNLDGGASSTFLTQREGTDDIELRNQPSNGYERKIAATLHIYTTAKATGEFDHVAFNEPLYECKHGETVSLDVFAVDKNGYNTEFPEGGKLVVSDDSYGTVSGTKFKAKDKTGTVTVSYVLDGETLASTEITISKVDVLGDMFRMFANIFNTMINLFERLIEELGERLFGI